MGLKSLAGKVAYGTAFVVALPLLLAAVARNVDASGWAGWSVPLTGASALVVTLAGLALMGHSMLLLVVEGRGLPMNAFPTTRRVARAGYRWIAHPIYAGFFLAVLGISGLAQSPGGFWLVAPLCALAAAALVLGYEGPMLRERFGPPAQAALLGLPAQGTASPSRIQKLAAVFVSLAPWALLYAALSQVPAPAQALDLRFSWEWALPHSAAAVWVYSALYPVVLAAPWCQSDQTALRHWIRSAWVCTAGGFLLLLTVPNVAPFTGEPMAGPTGWLLAQNRLLDAPWLAAPSFHSAWAVMSAWALVRRWPRLRTLASAFAAMVAVSCVATGSHAVLDVLTGALLGGAAWHHDTVWARAVRLAQRLGNSWSSTRLGPVRVISHASWSFAGSLAGTFLVLWLAGPQTVGATMVVALAGLLSAGAWGYWLEGGGRLSRPFGYYGYLFGSLAALGVLWTWWPEQAEPLMAAFAAGAPWAQALGRLRCVVQGCCHGRPVFAAYGMTVTHPMSRVTAMGNLCGVAIHPTPLYSIVANIVLGALLLRLWQAQAPWTLVAGLYLALSSLARFAEEHYRGEPQTQQCAGLPVYQWLAAGLFVAGLVVMALPGESVTSAQWIDASSLMTALLAGLCAAFAMSVDFPGSQRRLSRLTVAQR